jgi:hypothetical protein
VKIIVSVSAALLYKRARYLAPRARRAARAAAARWHQNSAKPAKAPRGSSGIMAGAYQTASVIISEEMKIMAVKKAASDGGENK